MEHQDSLFLIVTALERDGGLGSLTRALHGAEVPKALAVVTRAGSLLQQTVTSFQPLVPSARTYVVVPEPDAAPARGQLLAWSGVRVVAVPDGEGSAGTVMQLLAEILSASPEADVIVASADAYVPHPAPLVQSFADARERLGMVPAVVLGARVSRPTALGRWLLPGTRLGEQLFCIRECEPPATEEEARRLMAQGALWNTFSCVVRARYYWQLLARALPMQAESIVQLWRMGRPVSETLAQVVADAARGEAALDHMEVLMRERACLAMAAVEGSGWNAWGSPEEVLHSLRNPLERDWLLSRLAANQPPTPLAPMPLEMLREAPGAKL